MATLLSLDQKVFNEEVFNKKLLDFSEQEEKPFNRKSIVERQKAQEISITTNIPVDQIEAERATGDNSSESAAKVEGLNVDYALTIDQGYRDGMTSEQLASIIEQRTEKGENMTMPEYLLLQNLMLSDNDVNPYATRTLTNMNIWNNLIQKELEANDQTGFGKVMSFLDVNVLREITIGAFENVTFRSNREGKEIRKAFNDLTTDEFTRWAAEYIEERKNEGFFSTDSIWNLYKAANDATYLGDDPMAGAMALFGVLDIATLGSSKIITAPIKGATKGMITTAKERGLKAVSLTKSRSPVDTVAVMGDEVEAALVANKLVDDAGVQTDQINAGRSVSQDLDPVPSPTERPSLVVTRQAGLKGFITEALETMNRRGSFAELLPKHIIDELAATTARRIADKTNDTRLNSYTKPLDDGSDDYRFVVRLGKDGSGAAFRRKMDAEAIAAKDPSLKVVKKEQGRGWFVEAETRLDIAEQAPIAEIVQKSDFIRDTINKTVGAATVRLGDKLGAKFLQAESGQALIGKLIKPYAKTINAVKGKERENLGDFITQLRDGRYSYLRTAPTKESFESLYKLHYGSRPEQKTIDAYEALIDINDASWHIKASERLKRAVTAKGVFAEFTDDFGTVAYKVENKAAIDDEFIFDIASQKIIRRDKLKEDAIVFKTSEPYAGHIYFTNVKSTRPLERIDIMPYNIGGPRTNAEFRWFLGTVKEERLYSGKLSSLGFKTFLGSFGKDQIVLARKQLNVISTRINQLMKANNVTDLQQLTLTKVEYDDLGDIIRANNSWNKQITDLEDIQKLGKKYRFNFNEEFVFKARDEKIATVDEAGGDLTRLGITFGEDVGTMLNSQKMRRGDTPLMEFGGKLAVNDNPIVAMADQFGTEAFGYANRAATQNAIDGWNKLAARNEALITNWDDLKNLDPMVRFMRAEVTKTGKFNDVAAQLREQQAIIKRRLNQPTPLSTSWETFTTAATEAVFSITNRKIDFSKIGVTSDPSSQLLKVGFYSKFGFFNPDQFFLQGLHATTIAAVSPRAGTKAMGMAVPMMIIAQLPDSATRATAIRRFARMSGMTEDEIRTLVQYIDESGRNIIDNQVIELQAPQKFGVASNLSQKAQGYVGDFLDKSTFFFREGERYGRLTGIITAFLEHRAKRPDIDPLSPDGKAWITNREQSLTFRMTSASRSFAQSGPMRVPTQWLTFTLRAMENIVVGREFTQGERFRMALILGPAWGLTGIGMGKSTGYVVEKLGYNPSEPEALEKFNQLKYGFFDQLLGWGFGTDTAYAERAAPLGQVKDTLRKLKEESLMTTLLGPSGEIFGDMKSAVTNAIMSMIGGRPESVREDLTSLVRNITTVDKAVKIVELIETGNYKGRTRKQVVSNLDKGDAAAVLFGATPAPVQNYYDFNEMVFEENAEVKKLTSRLEQKARLATDLLTNGDEGDIVRGDKLWIEISEELWSSNLSYQLKTSIQNRLVNVNAIPNWFNNAQRLDLGPDAALLGQQLY
jgi:hypothetical protein